MQSSVPDEVFWSMLWFFLFFMWIWLAISIFGDIFRSPDLSGGGKAVWTIFVIFLPYLGVLVVPDRSWAARCSSTRRTRPRRQDEAFRGYVKDVVQTSPSAVDQLASLADLRDRGVIDDAEFQALKAKVTAGAGVA